MNAKIKRIAAIKEVIQTRNISSQEELLEVLKAKGFDLTQATLSRDLKQMQIAKVSSRDGGYMYVMPDVAASMHSGGALNVIPPHSLTSIVSIECSHILTVIRTKPGYASGIASDIDQAAINEVMGTIAGDDTVLVIPRGGYTPSQVAEAICHTLVALKF